MRLCRTVSLLCGRDITIVRWLILRFLQELAAKACVKATFSRYSKLRKLAGSTKTPNNQDKKLAGKPRKSFLDRTDYKRVKIWIADRLATDEYSGNASAAELSAVRVRVARAWPMESARAKFYRRLKFSDGESASATQVHSRKEVDSRNNNFVVYLMAEDKYAHRRHVEPEMVLRLNYGILERLLSVQVEGVSYELALIRKLRINDATYQSLPRYAEGDDSYVELVPVESVQGVVGRLRREFASQRSGSMTRYCILDRSDVMLYGEIDGREEWDL